MQQFFKQIKIFDLFLYFLSYVSLRSRSSSVYYKITAVCETKDSVNERLLKDEKLSIQEE